MKQMKPKSGIRNNNNSDPHMSSSELAEQLPWWGCASTAPSASHGGRIGETGISLSLSNPSSSIAPDLGTTPATHSQTIHFFQPNSKPLSKQSDGNCGDKHNLQRDPPINMPPAMNEYLSHPTQLELHAHSVGCASYPYSDPYYRGILPSYGPHSLTQNHGIHAAARMALPLEMAEEPVYVNAKQYHGILRRRQSRAKAEVQNKVVKSRKPYLHESRHLHAMRRARGCGGRFLNTKQKMETRSLKATRQQGMTTTPLNASATTSSSGNSENCVVVIEHQEKQQELEMEIHSHNNINNNNGNSSYYLHHHHHHEFHLPPNYHFDRLVVDDSELSRQQQPQSLLLNEAHTALTIK